MNTVNIYANDKMIIFRNEKDKTLKISADEILEIKDSTENEEIAKSFKQLINSKSRKKLFIQGDTAANIEKFTHSFKLIEAAGGFIQLNEKKFSAQKKFLFIFRNGKWDLPKGKLELGESIEEGAIRECEEECKVSELKIIKKLAPTYHMFLQKKEWIIKKTYWFLMESTFTGKLVPQKEEGITRVEWIAEKDFSRVKENTYPSVIDVMQSV
jgi:ADP-ribose pyrophosphatase YjhB (NUDIX family)